MPEGGKTGGTPAPGGSKEDPKQSGHKDDKPKEGGKRSYLCWGVGRRDRSHGKIWLLWGKIYRIWLIWGKVHRIWLLSAIILSDHSKEL